MRFFLVLLCIVCLFVSSCSKYDAITIETLLARVKALEERVSMLEKAISGKDRQQAATQEREEQVYVYSFRGEGMQITKPFTIGRPCVAEWKATDSIFYLFVRDRNGDNVSICGGSQSGSCYIHQSGTFFLDVKASGRWVVNIREAK